MLYQTRIEKILISEDGMWASAWLVPVDPQTGHDVHAEPGLALVTKLQGRLASHSALKSRMVNVISIGTSRARHRGCPQ